MTEFSIGFNGITHAHLVDGGAETHVVRNVNALIARSGVFSYYHIRFEGSSSHHFRVLAQPIPEVRLICLLRGQGVFNGCTGSSNVLSEEEGNCLLVKAGCEQDIYLENGGQTELFMVVVGCQDIPLSISTGQPDFHDFLSRGHCGWLLEKYNLPLRIAKTTVIQQVLNGKKPAYLKSAYIQLKLWELVVLFLDKVEAFGGKNILAQLRPDELERIRLVRALLDDRPAESYSLVGLARAVGTNEASLKRNFKAVYGTTVFGYLTARRMERAKALLLDNNLKVAAVAQEVGYKYASHFSAAFRKYFGYLPTKLLRSIVSMPSLLMAEEFEVVYPLLMVS